MTATLLPENGQTEAVVNKILQLPERKMRRILELGRLYRESTDVDEQSEIVKILAEILEPQLLGITWQRGAVEDLDASVDSEGMRRVEAYRREVGKRIRSARRARGLTQGQLANAAKLPQSHVSRIENGRLAATDETIKRIARGLNIDPGELDPSFE